MLILCDPLTGCPACRDQERYVLVRTWRELLGQDGYAVVDQGEDDADRMAAELGRSGPPQILAARPSEAADPWSLSGVYGLGAFPWHTDGAIDPTPPRWLLLTAMEITSPTSTELLDPEPEVWAAMRRTVLRAVDRHGRVRHLPAAVPGTAGWRLRWDPRTCQPTGELTLQEMASQAPTVAISWRVWRTLVVDNSRILHRRPAVTEASTRLLRRVHVWEI